MSSGSAKSFSSVSESSGDCCDYCPECVYIQIDYTHSVYGPCHVEGLVSSGGCSASLIGLADPENPFSECTIVDGQVNFPCEGGTGSAFTNGTNWSRVGDHNANFEVHQVSCHPLTATFTAELFDESTGESLVMAEGLIVEVDCP